MALAERSGVPVVRLPHYNDANLLPSGEDLERILAATGITEMELMLAMGRLSRATLSAIQSNAAAVAQAIGSAQAESSRTRTGCEQPAAATPTQMLETNLGRLFQGDCIERMRTLPSDSVDMIFADPPFNLNKLYPSSIYKAKMNPKGVNLSDVWWDIAPVRHAKYKRRNGANELPLKVLDRIVELSTDEGDLVFDPFGGSGTTYMAAELKGRRWIGVEIGPCDDIIRRFEDIDLDRKILLEQRAGLNSLFTRAVKRIRERTGWWTCESVRGEQAASEFGPGAN